MAEFPGLNVVPQIRPHLHKYLRIRLGIYIAIAVLVGAFVIYSAVKNTIPGIFAAVGFFIGMAIGFMFTRIHKIRWDEKAGKVIARMDIFGVLLFILYWAFELSRERIVGRFVSGVDVTVTSFSILAGIMYGRVLGIRGNVLRVLHEKDLL